MAFRYINKIQLVRSAIPMNKQVRLVSSQLFPSVLESTMCGGKLIAVSPSNVNNEHNLDDLLSSDISKEEIEYIKSKEHLISRQNMFLSGRMALRRALRNVSNESIEVGSSSNCSNDNNNCSPILRNSLGAPVLPQNVCGSISHKDKFAVAVARKNIHKALGTWSNSYDTNRVNKVENDFGHIGVDIERCNSKAYESLGDRLLTDNEQASLHRNKLDSKLSVEEDVLLRFSFKEAIFKALNPVLQRYIDFSEMEVYPQRDGKALLNFCLRGRELFEYEAEYFKWRPPQLVDNNNANSDREYWVTCVYMYHKHKLNCS